ncbi:ribonuclease H [Sesbania bispinosa]|nr:ribonuclease H [Sesbania bispinosa]
MGYEKVVVEEARGQSGGIWALAPVGGSYSFQVVNVWQQVVSLQVSCGNSSWICTAIYAITIPSIRAHLWEHLEQLRARIQLPWIAIEDYNEILFSYEQKGGFSMREEPRHLAIRWTHEILRPQSVASQVWDH